MHLWRKKRLGKNHIAADEEHAGRWMGEMQVWR